MTVGQRLREAREARQITLGDIARRTYIQGRFLQAIDEDNLAIVPASHLRLFVREYARMVGVDPNELYDLLPDTISAPAPAVVASPIPEVSTVSIADIGEVDEDERRTNRAILSRLSAGKGVKLVSGGASAWMLRGAVGLLVILLAYFGIRSMTGSRSGEAQDGDPIPGDSLQTQILPRADQDSSAAIATEDGDSLTLEGRAVRRVWFAIVADGKKSEQGTLDSGDVKSWRAAKDFRISLSNAGGLELLLNGKSLGTLGPLRTSVRNQVITADGLQLRGPTSRRAAPTTTAPAPTQRQNATPSTSSQRQTTPRRTTPPPRRQRSEPSSSRSRRPPTPTLTPTQPRGPLTPP